MLLVDDLAAGGTKNLRHTPRGLVTLTLFSLIIDHRSLKLGPYIQELEVPKANNVVLVSTT